MWVSLFILCSVLYRRLYQRRVITFVAAVATGQAHEPVEASAGEFNDIRHERVQNTAPEHAAQYK